VRGIGGAGVFSAGTAYRFKAKYLEEQAQMDTELRQLMSKIQEGLSEIQISKARPENLFRPFIS